MRSKKKSDKDNNDEVVITTLRKCVRDIWLVPDVDWHGAPMKQRELYRLRVAAKQKVRFFANLYLFDTRQISVCKLSRLLDPFI